MARCFFSLSRLSLAPLLPRVFFLSGVRFTASRISSIKRSIANSLFSTLLRVCWDMRPRTPSLLMRFARRLKQVYLLLGEAGRVCHIEPKGHAAAHFVDIIDYFAGDPLERNCPVFLLLEIHAGDAASIESLDVAGLNQKPDSSKDFRYSSPRQCSNIFPQVCFIHSEDLGNIDNASLGQVGLAGIQ